VGTTGATVTTDSGRGVADPQPPLPGL
jgi:hypothetical protein